MKKKIDFDEVVAKANFKKSGYVGELKEIIKVPGKKAYLLILETRWHLSCGSFSANIGHGIGLKIMDDEGVFHVVQGEAERFGGCFLEIKERWEGFQRSLGSHSSWYHEAKIISKSFMGRRAIFQICTRVKERDYECRETRSCGALEKESSGRWRDTNYFIDLRTFPQIWVKRGRELGKRRGQKIHLCPAES